MKMNVNENQPDKIVISEEIDKPLSDANDSLVSILKNGAVEKLERCAQTAEKFHALKLKDNAFWLIIICLVSLILLTISDTIFLNLNFKNSPFSEKIFELLKYTLTLLLGFLFAVQSNKD